MKKPGEKPKFKYDVDLNEEVPDERGGHVLRYGPARDREFMHMGADAPFRSDGALFDRMNPLHLVMPSNVQVQKGAVIPSGTGSFKILPDKILVT